MSASDPQPPAVSGLTPYMLAHRTSFYDESNDALVFDSGARFVLKGIDIPDSVTK